MEKITKTKKNIFRDKLGFTLIELLVVIAIIGILAGIVYANFDGAKASSRDESRKVALKELQLALELYKAQNGRYPDMGCSTSGSSFTADSCTNYIVGLTPDFISELPKDPAGVSYQYRTNPARSSYKVMTQRVESRVVTESDEFARCPSFTTCGGNSSNQARTYAVYGGPASAQW